MEGRRIFKRAKQILEIKNQEVILIAQNIDVEFLTYTSVSEVVIRDDKFEIYIRHTLDNPVNDYKIKDKQRLRMISCFCLESKIRKCCYTAIQSQEN